MESESGIVVVPHFAHFLDTSLLRPENVSSSPRATDFQRTTRGDNYGPVSPSADGSERTAASGQQGADSSSSAAAQQQLVLLCVRTPGAVLGEALRQQVAKQVT